MSYEGKATAVATREDEGFFSGPASRMVAARDRTKDNGDGTATVQFLVDVVDVPKDLSSSPLHSVWSLLVEGRERVHRLTGAREALQDKDGGKVMLRFAVFASSHRPEAVYGNRGEDVMLTVNLTARENNHPFMTTPAARHAVMQRCAMMCQEPGFGAWVAEACRRDGYATIEGRLSAFPAEVAVDEPGDGEREVRRAVEHLYRLARVHSRADVLDNNAAAGRVEDVIRRYRSHVWDSRDRERRSGRHG